MREKPTAAELKKLWSVKKVDAGTIELTAYHGTETDVEIPDAIGKQTVVRLNGTFKGNGTVQRVSIPKTITEITSGAFDGCSALEELILPEKLKNIGVSSFKGCSRLASITLHKSVTKIGSHFAANCVSLLELHLSDKIRDRGSDLIQRIEARRDTGYRSGVHRRFLHTFESFFNHRVYLCHVAFL